MSGSNKQTQTTTQQSSTRPWDEGMPLLQRLFQSYGGADTSVNPQQQSALDKLSGEANSLPSFDTTTPINRLLNSSTAPQVGMLRDAFSNLNSTLAPTVDPNNLDPYKTPGFSNSLNTLTQDITNNVKGVYSGSGRDPSGAGSFAQSLGRGLMQGEAPVVAGQFNANRGALMSGAGMLNSAGMNTANAITGQEQIPLMNAAAGIGMIPGVMQNALLPGQLGLNVANARYGLPYGNLTALLQPSLALAGMGSQSQGSGTSVTQQPQSTLGNIMGGISGGLGILGSLWSDKRAKDNIEEVGKLHDGQKVYRFNYKGDPTMRVGLLAQEVAQHEPDAVHKIGPMGMLAVDHKLATDNAVRKAA